MRGESIKTTDNPTVWDRLKRLEFSCSRCPAHQAENRGATQKKHGTRPPKDKRPTRK